MNLRSYINVIQERFGTRFIAPYMRGKTAVRDALYDETELSLLEAEHVVDELEQERILEHRLVGTSPPKPLWHVGRPEPPPSPHLVSVA